jgi:dTDP-4-amino-4,6-dideoxygalactose transaminase
VIADVDETLNLDPKDLKKKITKKTKAVVAVHMFGGQADMPAIRKVCAEKKIPILEDFSQCNGASIARKRVGSFGDVGVTSLQLNKAITAGEGGLLLTSSAVYAAKASARSDMGYPRAGGISDSKATGSLITVGEGRRFNEISAAIMRVQLTKLPAIAAAMLGSKQRMMEGLKMKGCKPRKVVDPKGDLGSTLTLIFDTEKEADAFCASGREALGKENWFMGQLKNTGHHIYYNCSNMVQKVPVLPGGFPWNLPENQGDYRYEKGTSPKTDELLARSVGLSIPPDLNQLQEEVLVDAMNMAFRGM